MIGFPKIQRYYLYTKKTDMRKGVVGLSGLVLNEMKLALRSGDGFVFFNKRKNMVKILVWDRTGFVIYYKQLSRGTFEIPEDQNKEFGKEISMRKLMLIMEGVKLKSIKYRKRYCG
jgi:transposase